MAKSTENTPHFRFSKDCVGYYQILCCLGCDIVDGWELQPKLYTVLARFMYRLVRYLVRYFNRCDELLCHIMADFEELWEVSVVFRLEGVNHVQLYNLPWWPEIRLKCRFLLLKYIKITNCSLLNLDWCCEEYANQMVLIVWPYFKTQCVMWSINFQRCAALTPLEIYAPRNTLKLHWQIKLRDNISMVGYLIPFFHYNWYFGKSLKSLKYWNF